MRVKDAHLLGTRHKHLSHSYVLLSAHTEALLLTHSKDDTYIVTEDVKTCCDILEKYKALIIIAKAGGGKSKTSLQIVKMYQEKLYTPMVFVNDEILRNRDLINFDDQNIVIIEDLFGRSNIEFNEDVHTGILDVLYSCLKTESCKSKLIISVRGNDVMIRKLIERHKLFEKEMFINLDKIKSLHINKLILSKHMNKHGISLCQCSPWLNITPVYGFYTNQPCESELFETNPNLFQVCVKLFNEICSEKYEMHIGFPQACHLFCSNSNFTKQGLEYFTHASQSLVNEINSLKNQGFDNKQFQYQYCTLVYTAIKSSLDMEDIDEHCFQHILSYFESKTIIMSLLKEAVRKLDGTYLILQSSSESSCDNSKRQKVSDIYVLQHNTIQEAILVSYGDDADVLPFCDLTFMWEYIRPKGHRDPLEDQMTFLFYDYNQIAKKLISMLSIDDETSTFVGSYLEYVTLFHRHDEMLSFFFQNVKDVKPYEYASLLNGLTSVGENSALVKFHPDLCKEIMIHAGMTVFHTFCRPIGWTDNNNTFVEIETDILMNKIYFIIATRKVYENCQKWDENKKWLNYILTSFIKDRRRYNIGNYVFENLIAKGFTNKVEILLKNLKENAQDISSRNVKEFLDDLLDGGKRSRLVSRFSEFFEAVLFKYGSIPTIMQLCLPFTSTLSSSNKIKVDDRLLTGKLSAYLEYSYELRYFSNTLFPEDSREDGAYFIYRDDYFKKKTMNLIAEYILEHGFKSNNHEFVRMMYEQLASEQIEKSEYDESVNEDSEICLDNGQNEDEFENDWAAKYTKVVFDDYPGDEIWEDDNGVIVHIRVRHGFVKKKYRNKNLSYYLGTSNIRLFLVLHDLLQHLVICMESDTKRIALLKTKFESLMNHLMHGLKIGKGSISTLELN